MVARLRPRQRQHRRGKEHGLVIGMRNQQAHALLQQLREAVAHGAGGADVDAWHGRDKGRNHHEKGLGVEVQLEGQVKGGESEWKADGVWHGCGLKEETRRDETRLAGCGEWPGVASVEIWRLLWFVLSRLAVDSRFAGFDACFGRSLRGGDASRWCFCWGRSDVGSQVQSACVRAFLRRREEKAGWSGGEQQKCGPQRGAEQLI